MKAVKQWFPTFFSLWPTFNDEYLCGTLWYL